VCDLEGIGAPSIFKTIRGAAALASILPDLCQDKTNIFFPFSFLFSRQRFWMEVFNRTEVKA